MKSKIILIIVILLCVTLYDGFYIVDEGQQAIVTRFGKAVHLGDQAAVQGTDASAAGLDKIENPGIKFKLPFIEQVHMFERRIMKWDGDPNQIPTKEKKYIWVDATARWRITDPLKFYMTVATVRGAQSRLDDIIDSAVRDVISDNYLVDIVRGPNYSAVGENDMSDVKNETSTTREKILSDIIAKAKVSTPEYGIEVIDVQIKRLNYIDKVLDKVYERMTSERNKVAAQYRSEGEGTRAEILGEMEKELKKIRSEAVKTAEEIKGKADAEAAVIYARAYSQDAEFYDFYRSMSALEAGISQNGKLVISTDSELFKYLKNAGKSSK